MTVFWVFETEIRLSSAFLGMVMPRETHFER